jgi:heat shock protein HslJ/uncharacterized membrane protein
MQKWIQLLVIVSVFQSCKNNAIAQNEIAKTEPTPAYNKQIENIEQGIYFRAVGNEPEWSLKISEKTIEFTAMKLGFEKLTSPHVEPVRAMDANVKMYRFVTETGTMSIQIMQNDCVNTMSGDKSSYSVQIEIAKGNKTSSFSGCGNYVTDYRLYDIWVLEKLKGKVVSLTDFAKELPNLEINSATNNFIGFAGCNRMNGAIFFERGLLRFSNIITTRRACSSNNKESEFLKALQSTTTYTIENRRLVLSNPSGEKLVFKKAD